MKVVFSIFGVNRFAVVTLLVFIGLGCNTPNCRAQQPDSDVPGAEVLTRGPVHEAFAGLVTFNPEPGVVVTMAPPAVIEEMPPEEKPVGDNVTWIPGYWAWDDERGDFLWVSGTWRALPPGRAWMAGYWGPTTHGFQWTSGYWADAAAQETTYLPAPPATVEVGPNIAAPSVDYGWSPGCWVWYRGRYAWRPGYWVQGRADWDWCPAHYVWTPRGYIFVGGFWDYPVERRGMLFAPVYFDSVVYSRRGYFYSPTIVINLGVFNEHLFLRPRYSHYYFGDYYAPSYYQGGFYASFSFQSGGHGYDPIYSHQRWEHRGDREWQHRADVSYQNRRDHEAARPPRTWASQRNIPSGTTESTRNRTRMATPISQLANRNDGPVRFQPVAREERQKLAQRGQEVQQSRDQRRALEANAANPTTQKPGAVFEPAKVRLPRSPIVARPANQSGRSQSPPKAPPAPRPDPKAQPKVGPTGRPPVVERSNPQPPSRRPETEQKSAPGRSEAAPRGKQVQPAPPPRAKESGMRTREDSRPNARAVESKTQRKPEPRAATSTGTAGETPPRNAPAAEEQPQRFSEPPARQRPDAAEKGATRLLRNDRQRQGNGRPLEQSSGH